MARRSRKLRSKQGEGTGSGGCRSFTFITDVGLEVKRAVAGEVPSEVPSEVPGEVIHETIES